MEPNNIFEVFFSFENPAIYAIAFTVIVVVLIFFIKREFIKPLTLKKRKLEMENAKLSALFAEVDPDPVLRTDLAGKVIDMNNFAKDLFDHSLTDVNIKTLIPNIEINSNGNGLNSEINLGNKNYTVIIKEIKELGYKHIYLHDITSRVEYEKKIKDYQNNLKELRIKIDSVNEEEKQRIGKELHDSVGHSLSLLKIGMQSCFLNHDISICDDGPSQILDSIDALSDEIRELSHQLKPRILNEFGLIPAVLSLVDRTNQKESMIGYVTESGGLIERDENLELNIYRICQEALNNIVKHSECHEFRIEFIVDDSELKVIILDDGKGFKLDEYMKEGTSSLGFLNMKERAESIGGTLSVDSIVNMGTTIYLNVKMRDE